MRQLLAVLFVVAGVMIPATTAHAQLLGSLSISAPASAQLGSAAVGTSTLSGTLGPVKVVDTRTLNLSWTATVSSASFTGPGLTVIPNASITYVSGTASAATGVVTPIPGPPLGVTLETRKTAFSATAVGSNSVTWNPTIKVAIPSNALTGSYSGTITHSVS